MNDFYISPAEQALREAEAKDPYNHQTQAGFAGSTGLDNSFKFERVSSWSQLGLKHPKPVAQLLKAAEQVNLFQWDEPSWEGIDNPARTAEVLQAHAEFAAGTGVDALKDRARHMLWSKIANLIGSNLEDYIEQLEQVFNPAADAYEEAVAKLPDSLSWEEIVADEEIAAAYRSAVDAAETIEAAKNWVVSLSTIGLALVSEAVKPVLFVVSPSDAGQLAATLEHKSVNPDTPEKKLNPDLLAAVRAGATLKLSSPAEAEDNLRYIVGQ